MKMAQRALIAMSAAALCSAPLYSQGTSGTLSGTVADATGALVPNASVTLRNVVSGYTRAVQADSSGRYLFTNIPFNHYHVTADAAGFRQSFGDVEIHNAAANTLNLKLEVGTTGTEITVDSEDLRNGDAVQSTTVDRELFGKLPLVQTSSPLSSLVTLSTPGIASDSNGLFHPLGEHADTTFAIDGQPISDQQSRVFGNPPSTNIIQSVNVINGIAPAEYGDKTSLVVETTTRSGLGQYRPTGTVGLNFGSFGTYAPFLAIGSGTAKLGTFLSLDLFRSGRYLDTPEFRPLHDIGNSENYFQRFDYRPHDADALQLNLSFSRSWFQQPNQYDQSQQDQRGKITSFNIAPSWTHIFNEKGLLSVGTYLRTDVFHYYPSANLFNDTPVSLSQSRRLQNAGVRADFSVTKGVNTFKAGATLYHTFLREGFGLGITDPTFNSPCVDANGAPVTDTTLTDPSQCAAAGFDSNDGYLTGVASYDLTRGGSLYQFKGRTDVKQEALYVQDTIAWKGLNVMLGGRADNYDAISHRSLVQPRLGVGYTIPKSGTVLRVGYGKFFLTPYNENLIVSSSTGVGGLEGASFGDVPLKPGARDQYTAGFEQSFGRFAVVSGEYFWKYTDRDFDFDVVLNTPLAFPIQWQKSKIDGFGLKVSVPTYHGVSAYSVLGHTRSRFFGPEVGGVLFNDPSIKTSQVFRIDHDQAFQQSTHLQYQLHHGPYAGFTWRYESGLVTDASRDPNEDSSVLNLTTDQQLQIQLACNGVKATRTAPITSCAPAQLSSPLINIPALGTEDDDHNPPRIKPRHLFDAQFGWDNVFQKDRLHTNLSVTATNITNKYSLYNFLSTFSGTHFVAPRQVSGQLSFSF